MGKIGRNLLADGSMGRFHCKGNNCYKQDKMGDGIKVSVDGRLTVFNGVIRWTYTFTLDQSSVSVYDYAVLKDPKGREVPGFDPTLETVVRYYWWAYTIEGDGGKPKLVSGKCPLPDIMGATWLPHEEIKRLDKIMGRPKGEAIFPLPIYIKVNERRGYNNPVAFGDESLKEESRRAAQMADEVDDGEDYAQHPDAVDDEPVDDVPTIQRGEAEHDKPVDQKEQSTRRRSRSS